MRLRNGRETKSTIHHKKHEFGLMFPLPHNPFKSTEPTAQHRLPRREQNTQLNHKTVLPVQRDKVGFHRVSMTN